MRRDAVGVAALVALSLVLRTRALDAGLWIDEAISAGIASHAAAEIPGVLRLDGSPPLYYLLLHGWVAVLGDGEAALRSLSLVAALATVPAAFWAGRVAAGARAAWIAAALAALNPFLTIYAQEARMYALVALLSLLACGLFVRGFVDGSGRHRAGFAVVLVALLYTHAWAIFLALAFALAAALQLRARLREAVLPFAAAALAFAPWVPTLVEQARHTGAPWSRTPSALALLGGVSGALDGGIGAAAVVAVGAVGWARVRHDDRTARVVALVALVGAVALVLAWSHSQLVSPSWANRYLAIVVGPVLVGAAVGLARADRLGIVAAVAVAVLWVTFAVPQEKSNVRALTAAATPLPPRTLVAATQPEQVPLLAYYLGGRHRYATPLGGVREPRVMDWRDALPRLRSSGAGELGRIVAALEPGAVLALAVPLRAERGWDAPWQREVLRVSAAWTRAAAADPRLRPLRTVTVPPVERSRTDLELRLYRRV